MTTCEKLAKSVVELLKEKNIKLATAESCTGGLISKLITDCSGASSVFDGGVVSYSNSVKVNVLGVDKDTLDKYGAVSAPVAVMMARGTRSVVQADIGVSVTGIAGPNSDITDKPVGLIYVSVCDSEYALVKEIRNTYSGDDVREKNRQSAALTAFEMIEQYARLYPEKADGAVRISDILSQY